MRQYICFTHIWETAEHTATERGTLEDIKRWIWDTELLTKGQSFSYRHVIVELPPHVENAWDATPAEKTTHTNRICRAHTANGKTTYSQLL